MKKIEKGDLVYTTSAPVSPDGTKRYGIVMEIIESPPCPRTWARVLWTGVTGAAYVPVKILSCEHEGTDSVT